jgi:hypothetical protein
MRRNILLLLPLFSVITVLPIRERISDGIKNTDNRRDW